MRTNTLLGTILGTLLSLALVLTGCGATGLESIDDSGISSGPGNDGGTGTTHDGSAPIDGSGSIADLAQPTAPPDLNPGGAVGTPCKTACDCMAGLACYMGQCVKSQFGPVYCCDSMNCPMGSYCQSLAGRVMRCGGGMGGSTDGGMTPGYCRFVPCKSDQNCQQAGCGACDTMKGRCL